MGDKFQDGIRAYQLIASLEAEVKEWKVNYEEEHKLRTEDQERWRRAEAEITILNETVKELKLNLAHEEQNVLYGMKDDRREKRRLQDRLDFAVDLLKQSQPDAQSAPSLHGRIREFLSTITDTKGAEGKD